MKLFLVAGFALLSVQVQAQFITGLEDFTLLDVRTGASVPAGKFSQTTGTDFESGYATPGIYFSGSLYQSLADFFSLGGTVNYSLHGFNEDALRRSILDQNPSVMDAYVESTLYSTFNLTVGPSFFVRFSEQAGVQLKTEAGLLRTLRPQQTVRITYASEESELALDSFGGSSFSIYMGAQLRYHATEKTALALDMGHYYGKPYFEYIKYQYPNWIIIENRQVVSFLIAGICLSYIVGY